MISPDEESRRGAFVFPDDAHQFLVAQLFQARWALRPRRGEHTLSGKSARPVSGAAGGGPPEVLTFGLFDLSTIARIHIRPASLAKLISCQTGGHSAEDFGYLG